ncbi:ABC transporter ATP-binding protein [Arthrobacter sp. SW1]|uniref:ATP-binding cassette domain-containing protein n=1 Tax=Arthrobacter sp. SW1 TaxID=1920889 RepID=UPI000877CF73|nr:ATP-binding cassette domain-containing protein [Arthrobacter sp. SW1]OFI37648.1 ABC transporter ATP-binding protein [Arthrobacter sp. SW1]
MKKSGAVLPPCPATGRTASAPLVSLQDARVRKADGTVLLSVAELTVMPGERVVVTGPSGSGKSLLLASLAGRWAPGLAFEGRRSASFARVGFVPQRGLDALHPLIPLGRQLRRVTDASAARVTEVLAAAGLPDAGLQHRRPAELSGGQAQRAAVALAALSDAPLVLADEPTSALDPESRDLVLRLLDELIGAERTLVVSTHDEEVADALATRRIRVAEGQSA